MYVNPYQSIAIGNGKWLKANFHVHASLDGSGKRCEISEVIYMYKDADYDVLTISNQTSFVDTKEFGEKFDILTINGIEYIEKDGILCIGINAFIQGEPQDVINECSKQGGFAVISHPNWISEEGFPPALTKEMLKPLKGYIGLEILTPGIFNRFKGSGLATDVWDEFLTEGKLIWGFANDDFHTYHNFDKGWNVIYARERDYASIKAAVERGSLYASTGLWLKEFLFEDNTIRVAANFNGTPAKKIRYEFIGENGKMLFACAGETGVYRLIGDEPYVRVQATSEHGAMLWTQPVYNNEILKYC
jgi:hypothetical protein